MNSLPDELAKRFGFNLRLLEIMSDGLSADAWSAVPGDQGNSAHWILGHVATTRRQLVRKLGVDLPVEEWEGAFGRGVEPNGTEGLRAVADLVADLEARQAELDAKLIGMDAEAANAAWGVQFPDGSETVLEAASFLQFHETYHLGQIGLLRRQTGHPGFA